MDGLGSVMAGAVACSRVAVLRHHVADAIAFMAAVGSVMPDWPLPPPRQPLLSEPVPASSGPSRLPAAQYAKLLVPTPELKAVPLPALVARRWPALLLAPRHEIVPF